MSGREVKDRCGPFLERFRNVFVRFFFVVVVLCSLPADFGFVVPFPGGCLWLVLVFDVGGVGSATPCLALICSCPPDDGFEMIMDFLARVS